MTMTRVWWTPLLLVLAATPAQAQLCRGGPAFAGSPYQIGGMVALADGTQAYGGDFGVGGRYLFAGAGFSARHVEEADGWAAEVSSRIGVEARISQSHRIFFCPVAFVSFGTGPDIGEIDVSRFTVGGGARVGVVARDTDALQIVPIFGIEAVRERRALRVGGTEQDQTDGYGAAALGVGFIVNRRVSLTPEVAVPFSAADSGATVVIRLTYGFNR